MPPKDASQKAKKKLCPYFLKGTCAYGEKCARLHEANGSIAAKKGHHKKPSSSPSTSRSRKAIPVHRSPTPPDFGAMEASGPAPPTPKRPISPSMRSVQSLALCQFYMLGGCALGGNCEFLHQDADKSQVDNPRPATTNREQSAKICTDFSRGKCNRGSRCPFLHASDENVSVAEAPTPDLRKLSSPPQELRVPSPVHRTSPRSNYRPTSPFGYQGVLPETPRQEIRPDIPIESDTEDTEDGRYDDADEEYDRRKNEISNSILKGGFSEGTSNAISPDLSGYQGRAYPEVPEAPKPIPHVIAVIPHWSQFADPKANGEVPFCKQLAQNQCILRDECRFRHSLTIDEYTLLFKDLQPNLWTISRTDDQPTAYLPSTMTPTPFPSAPPSVPPPAPSKPATGGSLKRSCAFYPLGKCANGHNCPYRHDGTPPNNDSSSSQGRSSTTALPASDSSWNSGPVPRNFPKVMCRHFEAGLCRFGDSCHYSHSRENAVVMNEDEDGNDEAQDQDDDDNGWGVPSGGAGNWGEEPVVKSTNGDDDRAWGSSTNYASDRNEESSGGSRTRRGICFDFSAGRCRRGDSCRFMHEGDGGGSGRENNGGWSDSSRRKPQPCHQFQKGMCNRGAHCRFSHDEVIQDTQDVNGDNGWGSTSGAHAADSWGAVEEENGDAGQAEEGGNEWHVGEEGTEDVGEDGDEDVGEEWDGDVGEEISEVVPEPEPPAMNNDDSWAARPDMEADDWSEAPSVADGETGKIQKPCKAFGQGVCERGESCLYLHELPEDQWQYHGGMGKSAPSEEPTTEEPDPKDVKEETQEETQEVIPQAEEVEAKADEVEEETDDEPDDPPDLERFMHYCTVRFNSRCSPTVVMTAAESRKILLSNLPPDSTVAEIRQLVQSVGPVQDVTLIGEQAESVTMAVEFENHADGMAAVKQYNDQLLGSRPISARLDSRTPVFARSPLHSPVLMVSWPGPVLTAWAYYDNVTLAKAAALKLDKVKVHDREIQATFERPVKRQPSTVRLGSLPPATSKADVEALCKDTTPNLTTLGQPTYQGSPEDAIRQELGRFGPADNFRISPEGDKNFKTIAYVTMKSYSVAHEAANALRDCQPDYLGKQALKVQHIYLATYKVFPQVLECILNRLNVLRQKYKGKCKIVDFTDTYLHTIEVRASIDESTMFSEANAELNVLIDGMVVVDEEGHTVWDPYLELSSSTKAIDKINDPSSDIPCFVHCDPRLKCVRIYGSLDGQQRGKAILLKTLKKVKEQCYDIILERPKIGALLDKGLTTLRDSLGINKISFNIVESRLIVRGAQAEYEKAKLVVSVLASSPPPESTGTRSTLCPLCERVPVSPVKLTCRHAYCKACLQFVLSSTAKRETTFFHCVFDMKGNGDDGVQLVCGAPLSYVVVRDNLPTVTEVEYLKASFLEYVKTSDGRFFFCPTPECPAIYRSGEEGIVIRCDMCSIDICPSCCSRIHDGSLCQENRIPIAV